MSEITIDEIKKTIAAYEKQENEKPITRKELTTLLKNIDKEPSNEHIHNDKKPSQKMTKDERKQLAFQLYRDAKKMSVVCLLGLIVPFIVVFVAMVNAMAAVLIAFCGVIYPVMILMQMINIQTRAYHKYGWKPLLQFRPQNPMQQHKQPQYKNQEEML